MVSTCFYKSKYRDFYGEIAESSVILFLFQCSLVPCLRNENVVSFSSYTRFIQRMHNLGREKRQQRCDHRTTQRQNKVTVVCGCDVGARLKCVSLQ